MARFGHPSIRHSWLVPPTRIVALLAGVLRLAARASLRYDDAKLATMTALRGAIGDHPRVPRIEVDADAGGQAAWAIG